VLIVQEMLDGFGVVAVQVQDDGAVVAGHAGQHRAAQAWPEGVEKLHRLQCRFPALA
jgi:hypothetical protein